MSGAHGRIVCAALAACCVASSLLTQGCGRVGFPTLVSSDAGSPRDGGLADAAAADGHGRDGATGPRDGAPVDAAPVDAAPVDAAAADAGPCAESPCRLVLEQCGCVAGEMCTRPFPMSAERACRPAGTTAPGGACTFSVECAAGTGCIRANGAGSCAYWCGSPTDCGAGSRCARFSAADPMVGACSWPCDPMTSEGCPPTHQCVAGAGEELGTGAPIGLTFCAGPGSVPIGDLCSGVFDCVGGAECDGVCRPICVLGGAPCTPPASCVALTPEVRVGESVFGSCR